MTGATEETTQAAVTQPQTNAVAATHAADATAPAATTPPKTGAGVDAAWFDDAVFVGDSVTLKLSYYCEDHPEALSDTQFFCAGSLSYTNALWPLDDPDAVHPYYQGQTYLTEDCAKVTGAKKVFIMLGMNDIGLSGVDGAMENANTLIGNIKKNSPDVTFYIESVTPMIPSAEGDVLNNTKIRELDERLEQFANENGYQYLDLYHALADEDGCLPLEYCGDPDGQGIHFTDEACELWVQYLKENVR
ncbi:MAG: hypothetical protein II127_08785 [Ruminococcus sp.]|nr:hypothetical protein [Ruminococcus sp.]